MVKKILTYPNKKLNEVSKDVAEFNEELHNHLRDMKDTLDSTQGVGLASIQIGVPLNVLIIKHEGVFIEAINPVIMACSGKQTSFEGCLSIPNVNSGVERALKIHVEYYDRNGKVKYCNCDDRLSVIWQHETEHLKGGLYIDNLSKTKRKKLESIYKKANK